MAIETARKIHDQLEIEKKEPIRKFRNKYVFVQWRLFCKALREGKVSFRKLWNVFLCDLSFLLKWEKGPPSPYVLSLEPWNECNAGCLFCRDKKGRIHDLNPEGTGFIEKGKMPAQTAKNIISQLKDDVLVAVLYTNGEPLLYQPLAEVIRHATDKKVATIIATNGLLFTEENAKAILEAGVDLIKIQLSGYTQEIYSVQIRYGHVEKLKENIRMLARLNKEGGHGAVILIDYILYNYNRHHLPLVKKFCKENGLMMNIRPGNPFGGLENLEPPLTTERLPLKISCDYLWKVMQINHNGDVLPCCEAVVWSTSRPYERFEAGKTELLKVWRGENARKMRRRMNTEGRAGTDMCRQCTRKGVCFKW